jgi:hypothetical protein
MDLEALRLKALQSLRQRQQKHQKQQQQQESSSDSLSSDSLPQKEDGELSDSPERTRNKRNFTSKIIFTQKRSKQQQQNYSLQPSLKNANYFWHKRSRPELLASLDSLLQIVREAEITEQTLRQRTLECRHLKKTAQRQLESLQSYLSSPYTMHAIAKPIERADRWFTHLVMRDSSLLWFRDRFVEHPAFSCFVTHLDSPTFKSVNFDISTPFCLEEACFGHCTCLEGNEGTEVESLSFEMESLSFNHFSLFCK